MLPYKKYLCSNADDTDRCEVWASQEDEAALWASRILRVEPGDIIIMAEFEDDE